MVVSKPIVFIKFVVLLTIVNEGSSLTIVNKQAFWKTIVLKTTIFKKQTFKKNFHFLFDFSSSFS